MKKIDINTNGTLRPPKIAHLVYPGSLIVNIVVNNDTGKKSAANFDTQPTIFPSLIDAIEARKRTSSSKAFNALSISSARKLKSSICSAMFLPPLRDATRSAYGRSFCWSRICRCREREMERKKGTLLGNVSSQKRFKMRHMMYRACTKNIELVLSTIFKVGRRASGS
jgi:hypothetical protein